MKKVLKIVIKRWPKNRHTLHQLFFVGEKVILIVQDNVHNNEKISLVTVESVFGHTTDKHN